MNDTLTTFCEDLALTALSTVGTDSYLMTNPLAVAAGTANPATMSGNAHYNENVAAAFYPRSNGIVPLYLEAVCRDPAGASMTDITVQLIVADDALLTTNVQVLAQSGNVAKAKLDNAATENVAIYVPVPPLNPDLLDSTPLYMGVRFVATGSGGDYGTWTVSLVTGVKRIKPSSFESGTIIPS